jgi:putative hydrolase of the HAD superfamily
MITLAKTCVVLDLDDTLYSERDYQQSGYQSIIDLCRSLFAQDVSAIVSSTQKKNGDVLHAICNSLCLPDSVKQSFLWHYRLHKPDIQLCETVESTLKWVTHNAKSIAIITDGREISQKQKLLALGLQHIPAFISESWGETKPGLKRFKHIEDVFPANRYVYIGDNIKKDFITPNYLGWLTVGIKDAGSHIHKQDLSISSDYHPQYWVDSFFEIRQALIG